MRSVHPVLLCGGAGSRLWPLSRRDFPKQFVPLVGEETLFQSTARRLAGHRAGLRFEKPITLTGPRFRFLVAEQLSEAGIDPGAVLVEPMARNTAAPVLAAAFLLARDDPDALMLVSPSDHLIPDAGVFGQAVARGASAAEEGKLVAFGVVPRHAETAYGYLELATAPPPEGPPVPATRFIEKPCAKEAERLLRAGNCLWNSGIYLARAADMVSAFANCAPDLVAPVRDAVDEAVPELGFLRLEQGSWEAARDISLDYAVMERAPNLSVVALDADWSDLGGWDAVWRHSGQAGDGVALSGEATALDCTNTLLRSESDSLQLVGIGLENVMAIATEDAVLVADMSRAQDVRRAVAALREKGAPQATSASREHHPWGWREPLATGRACRARRLCLHPGARLDMDRDPDHSMHWFVAEGVARVTVGGRARLVEEGESVLVPRGAAQGIRNPGKEPLLLVGIRCAGGTGPDDPGKDVPAYARA